MQNSECRVQNAGSDFNFKDHRSAHYSDGDNGRGVGASHQTGWTGLIAKLLQPHDGVEHTRFTKRPN
jgi:hypothetical protein